MTSNKNFARLLHLLTVICIFSAIPTVSAREEHPFLSLRWRQVDQNKEISFKDILISASNKFHITIIAEDEPLRTGIPVSSEREIWGQPNQEATVSNVMQAIGNAFDYSVHKQNARTFLLEKRFTVPRDLPCVTLEEWNASVEDIARMAKTFSPNFGGAVTSDPRTKAFAQSLSPEQLSSLKSDNGLPVEAMTEEQKKFMRELCLYYYVEGPVNELVYNVEQGKCITNEATHYGWFNRFDKHLFGYEGPLGRHIQNSVYTENHYFRPLSHLDGFSFNPNGTYGWREIGPAQTVTNPPVIRSLIPSNITDIDETKPEKDDRRVSIASETLGVVTSKLNQLLSANPTGSVSNVAISVEPELAEKRVTVVGSRYTSPSVVFQGLARVYGLQVRTKSGTREKVISRYRPGQVESLTALRAFISKALPAPFLRFAKFDPSTDENGHIVPPNVLDRIAMVQWRVAAIKRLRATLEPRLEETKKEKIAFTDLLDSERIALVNVLMSYHAATFMYFVGGGGIQPCIGEPESVVVTGGLLVDEHGKKVFSLLVNTKNPDGHL